MDEKGLYIHIPFCKKKCLYCDFPSFSGCEGIYEDYISSLLKEMEETAKKYSHMKFSTIFVGGGTPTVLPPMLLGKVLDMALNKFSLENNAEITVEVNPATVDSQYFKELSQMEVNRLSFGVQACQEKLLKTLGRIHSYEDFVKNFHEARNMGFKNISCDIMFALPNQSLIDWEETLDKITRLNPEHISAYSLIVEEGTPFKTMFDRGDFKLTDETLDRQMYYLAKEFLKDKGYNPYEISNFAKKGFESKHNIIYWKTGEYIGVGLGSHSYVNKERFHNTYDMQEYILAKGNISKLRQNRELLSERERIEEFMFMGLRMEEGISKLDFEKRFGKSLFDIYKEEINLLFEQRLINIREDRVFLTEKGIDLSNFVFEKFII